MELDVVAGLGRTVRGLPGLVHKTVVPVPTSVGRAVVEAQAVDTLALALVRGVRERLTGTADVMENLQRIFAAADASAQLDVPVGLFNAAVGAWDAREAPTYVPEALPVFIGDDGDPYAVLSITKNDILDRWRPEYLTDVGSDLKALGSNIVDVFGRYMREVEIVRGDHWQGVTADAAQHRSYSDWQTAQRLDGLLHWAAETAIRGSDAIASKVRRARDLIVAAEGAGFVVRDDLSVDPIEGGSATAERQTESVDWQYAIVSAADLAWKYDLTVAIHLNYAASSVLRPEFVAPATLGSLQGEMDVRRLLNSPPSFWTDVDGTNEMIQRLVEAGNLTPDQLGALNSPAGGAVTIHASQMAYIKAFVRGLHDKSPDELKSMMAHLGRRSPDAQQALAQVLHMVSNDRVQTVQTTSDDRGDANKLYSTGGKENLPGELDQALNRADPVTTREVDAFIGTDTHAYLSGVGDARAAADIADMASRAYRNGSMFDAEVKDAGDIYIHAQDEADTVIVDGVEADDSDEQLTAEMFDGPRR